ncbi:MAG: hypothetical protein GY826_44970, partial [Fuerstiella sp.]|nr:hypothetical protein [Fuerstiella sp.]
GLLHKLIVSGEQISQFREVAGDLEEIFISVTQQASQENMVTAESTPVAEAAS